MESVTEIEEVTHPRGRSRNGASTPNTVVIGPRDDLKGTLSVEGDVRIEGTVEGEVRATGDIEIDASATVRARLEGRGVAVRGNVTGDVVAWKRLSVHGSGALTGDVRTPRLRVDDGTVVNGAISMRPEDATTDGAAATA